MPNAYTLIGIAVVLLLALNLCVVVAAAGLGCWFLRRELAKLTAGTGGIESLPKLIEGHMRAAQAMAIGVNNLGKVLTSFSALIVDPKANGRGGVTYPTDAEKDKAVSIMELLAMDQGMTNAQAADQVENELANMGAT